MAARRCISLGLLALLMSVVLAGPARAQDTIYWSTFSQDEIRSAAADGSGPVGTLYTGQPDSAGIDVDGDRLVWAVRADSSINAAPVDGSGPVATLLGGLPGDLTGITVDHDADRVIFGDKSTELRTAPLAGGASTVLYGGLDNTLSAAADTANDRVYFVSDGGLGSAPLDGSGPVTSLAGPGPVFGGVAVDAVGGFVYWTEENTGAIRRVAVGGGPVETLYTGQSAPEGIAVDNAEGYIYWASFLGNAIRRAPLAGGGSVETIETTNTPYFLVLRRTALNTASPAVTGTRTTGSQLTCEEGTWSETVPGSFVYRPPVTGYDYEWQKDGAAIPGATASTYTPTEAGAYSCTVTATNAVGASQPADSSPVAVAAAATPPPPSPPATFLTLNDVGLDKRCIRAARTRARGSAKQLTLSYHVSRAARLTFTLQRQTNASKRSLRRTGCPKRSPRRPRSRVVFRDFGSPQSYDVKAGTGAATISANGSAAQAAALRVVAGRRLQPGRYRMLLRADAGGATTPTAKVKFWVLAAPGGSPRK